VISVYDNSKIIYSYCIGELTEFLDEGISWSAIWITHANYTTWTIQNTADDL